MDLEPLSEVTLRTKRNLLASSALTLAVQGFDLTVGKLPIFDAQVNIAPGVLPIILGTLVAYFLIGMSIRSIEDYGHASRRLQIDRAEQNRRIHEL